MHPIAQLAEELGHGRGDGRGNVANDVEVSRGDGVLANHDFEGAELGGGVACGVVGKLQSSEEAFPLASV